MAGKNKLSYDKKWVKTSWTYSTDKCDKITIFFHFRFGGFNREGPDILPYLIENTASEI